MLNPLERFSAECADGNIPAHTLQVRAPVQIKKKKKWNKYPEAGMGAYTTYNVDFSRRITHSLSQSKKSLSSV